MSRHSSPPKKRSRTPRWFKYTVIVVLVVANLLVLGAWLLARNVQEAFVEAATVVPDVDQALTLPVSGEPQTFLVVGSDSREGLDDLTNIGDFAGARGDVIMLVKLLPETSSADILSIPRDYWVEIPGHGEAKINAAYAYGGAPLMVETIETVFDIPINHYVEMSFVGFQSLVEQIGGVDIDFDAPARDTKTGLEIASTGTQTLDGEQALAFARSRSYQEMVNGQWVSRDADDIGRTERQQELVRAILSEVTRPSSITEAGDLVGVFAQHVAVDEGLLGESFLSLAFSMRGVKGSDLDATTLPTVGDTSSDGQSILRPDDPAASEILAAFRSGGPTPDVSEDDE